MYFLGAVHRHPQSGERRFVQDGYFSDKGVDVRTFYKGVGVRTFYKGEDVRTF